MQKHYPFQDIEHKAIAAWGMTFSDHDITKTPYTIMMPPPNVTGSLHLGHAFSSTLQDILIRWRRMSGDDTLWLPGTDHAGIATQMMVEKHLAKEGIFRKDIGRKAFLEHVWAWKEKHGDLIVTQMKHMGFSADWEKLSFTLDPSIHDSVLQGFVDLYDKGLIYRAERLINWDPILQTAISDLEVVSKERQDKMFTLQYDLEDGGHICIATTRPETLFGDVAIAVHPDDQRYAHLVGKHAVVPLAERRIPIVADDAVLQDKGTGAVKITPAHDFLDFEIGQRHTLASISIFDRDIRLNDQVPMAFRGLDKETAREKVLHDLGPALLSTQDIVHMVPHSDRSGAILEPLLTKQWFVEMQGMAEKGLKAVAQGDIVFLPKDWTAHYVQWLENIQPWCISRQLWWGHQIPAWYTQNGDIIVAKTQDEAYEKARHLWGPEVTLTRDEDVLDTWFSSGLWPFSTLGWPDDTKDLQRYYPGNVLITGFDILFFWVARMIMLGLELTGKPPFKTVYLHPLIRDEKGQKMSKTKGNVINPLDVIKDYGADALRFSLAWIASPSQHAAFSLKHVEHARNFITKIWNVSRFMDLHGLIHPEQPLMAPQYIFNRWILEKTEDMLSKLQHALSDFRFQEAAFLVHHFTWHVFCDWYIEMIKDALRHEPCWEDEIRRVTTHVLSCLLKALHPFIPFVTEALWSFFGYTGPLCSANFPTSCASPEETGGDRVIGVISQLRKLRAELSLKEDVAIYLETKNTHDLAVMQSCADQLRRLVGVSHVYPHPLQEPVPSANFVTHGMAVTIPLEHLIDVDAEKVRLAKQIASTEKTIEDLRARLDNPLFQEKASHEAIDKLKKRLEEACILYDHQKSSLSMLGHGL